MRVEVDGFLETCMDEKTGVIDSEYRFGCWVKGGNARFTCTIQTVEQLREFVMRAILAQLFDEREY